MEHQLIRKTCITGRFLQVATGIAKKREAYLNIDNNLQMTDAYTVNIA